MFGLGSRQASGQPASNAARSHSMRSPSTATTSKRHGGGAAPAGAGSGCAASTRRRCLAAPMLAAAPPKRLSRRAPHLDEHQRAVAVAHDQVDLAAARPRPARDPIIALHQRQARRRRGGPAPALRRHRRALSSSWAGSSPRRRSKQLLDAIEARRGRGRGRRRAAVSRGRAVRRRHADRQPGRPDAARAARARRWSTRSPARTRATAPRCCATSASPSRCSRVHEHNEREAARRGARRGWRAASAWPTSATPARRRSAIRAPRWWRRRAPPAIASCRSPAPAARWRRSRRPAMRRRRGFAFVGFLPRAAASARARSPTSAAPRRRRCCSRRRIASRRSRSELAAACPSGRSRCAAS